MGVMQSKSDAQLLHEYVEDGIEPAFTEIVTRYTNLVYSAAARQTDSPDIAAEITQSVFVTLARGAGALSARLAEDASLAGWLCRSARNISLKLRRDEFRRHSRERQAMQDLSPTSETTPDWERLRPVLDEAMSKLSDPDYDALVMRFFNNQDLRSVGRALGVTDDTAQKRVSRALDKLREYLFRRGIKTTAAALVIVLSANAVQTAPVGLAVAISSAATLAGTTIASTAITATTNAVAMSILQKTLIILAVAAGGATPLIIQHNAQVKLSAENQSLRQQIDQLAQLTAENERLSNLVAQSTQSLSPPSQPSHELLRLRGEVGLLRQQNQGLAQLLAQRQQTTSAADFQPSSSWTDSGNATPEAAADTFAWAIKTGRTDKLADVLVFETDQTNTNRLPTAEIVSKDFQSLMSEIDASRLLLTDDSVPDQVTFWYQSRFKDGHTLVSPLTLQRVDSSWRVKLIPGGDEARQ
jgi:RNA polymerase sigma factor (sigma-70 family)